MTRIHTGPSHSDEPRSDSTADGDGRTLLVARRAWFRMGVLRRDRARLTADLRSELTAAHIEGLEINVLGDDPESTAREWAEAQHLTHRRLRLLTFVPLAIVAAALAGSACLTLLADGFIGAADGTASTVGARVVLPVYLSSAVLAAAAMCGTVGLVLHRQRDPATIRTVRILAVMLLPGGVLAAAAGIGTADLRDFTTVPATFVLVAVVIIVVLVGTLGLARWLAVRGYNEATGTSNPTAAALSF